MVCERPTSCHENNSTKTSRGSRRWFRSKPLFPRNRLEVSPWMQRWQGSEKPLECCNWIVENLCNFFSFNPNDFSTKKNREKIQIILSVVYARKHFRSINQGHLPIPAFKNINKLWYWIHSKLGIGKNETLSLILYLLHRF